MKAFFCLLLIALASASNIDTFRSWMKQHGKLYTGAEEAHRFAIFKENLAIIERLNLENHGATFGPNKFSDLTNSEFKSLYTSQLPIRQVPEFAVIADGLKDELDYKSILPAVKDQAQCGSCWAFSTVANMEGAWYMKHQEKVALSEQQLVSCDKTDSGCNGGLMTQADDWVLKKNNGGIATEASYPYTSGTGYVPSCDSSKKNYKDNMFTSYHGWGKVSSDSTLIGYLKEYGPLSIAIEADRSVFQSYKSGVLDSSLCGTTLDHGVTLIGYGTDAVTGKDYWTVRNSWGPSWGENGYIRLARGKNMCGLNSMVSSIVA